MGQRHPIDSNAVIDYIEDKLPVKSALALDRILDSNLNTSIVVRIEVLGFNGLVPQMQKLKEFLDLATTYYIDDDIAVKTIELRKTYQKLKLGDAIIAATALVHDLTIITRNTKDFKNIEGIDCMNPHKMG
ncbi:type II toxin-antitoxin system VapC family toxin [Salmonirosea aquatica]|uniref:PIN domain-containing protein n=1 Tax=Salmonirosea aquatica TaxID=2654236 RepID=A0A7C9FZG8_9BACT|nr:PIN domain-containing protein [Cytophagaceae bacterium SJW1-29]